jgi:acylphosphatase
VRGHVQGVFFRASTSQVADRLGVRARVWNREDGAVECVAEGPAPALAELEAWLRQGPPAARVESVERSDDD